MMEYDPFLLQQSIYKDSYYDFFIDAFNVLEPQIELVDNWHIKYLCDTLQEEIERIARGDNKTKDIIINIPPRTLKSSIVTIMLNAWAWIKYPHLKFITSSYSGELSIEHAVQTRKLIESPWYREYFRNSYSLSTDQNVKSRFTNDMSGIRRSTSVSGTLTGQGADVIIVDDPHKADEVYSETKRQNVLDWYRQTLYTRLNDQQVGVRIIIMQRLHENDLTGYLLENASEDYKHICIPAEVTKDISPKSLKKHYKNNLFFPEKFGSDILSKYERQMSKLQYAGQMLQSPQPIEGNLIKRSYFGSFSAKPNLLNLPRNFYSDTAYGKEESDKSATICYSKHDNDLYVWGMWVVSLPFPEFIEGYKSFILSTRYDSRSRCYFEPKASGLDIVQHLKTEKVNGRSINVIEADSPKDNKLTRVQAKLPFLEAGRVKLLSNQSWCDSLIQECVMFPNAKHDDQVDALIGAIDTLEKPIFNDLTPV